MQDTDSALQRSNKEQEIFIHCLKFKQVQNKMLTSVENRLQTQCGKERGGDKLREKH